MRQRFVHALVLLLALSSAAHAGTADDPDTRHR